MSLYYLIPFLVVITGCLSQLAAAFQKNPKGAYTLMLFVVVLGPFATGKL